jgi:hypothetical protein
VGKLQKCHYLRVLDLGLSQLLLEANTRRYNPGGRSQCLQICPAVSLPYVVGEGCRRHVIQRACALGLSQARMQFLEVGLSAFKSCPAVHLPVEDRMLWKSHDFSRPELGRGEPLTHFAETKLATSFVVCSSPDPQVMGLTPCQGEQDL